MAQSPAWPVAQSSHSSFSWTQLEQERWMLRSCKPLQASPLLPLLGFLPDLGHPWILGNSPSMLAGSLLSSQQGGQAK